ncbi:hypothetical protein C0Q70_14874 [Pomacea canaliculata]|uniref:Peregrin n=1 Tax=Pomacea canaliculata TaxID=400727 RepID=A0A2T7NTA0_POMCA|nr:peregrin-like isoform X2 [Pomacea canaliculata]PVD24392.1 hypothetical protein C0Q70_14874 [Pomacea canaliculata]
MVLDFDVKTFCQNLRATKPPYECPIRNCGKVYKSFSGIQFHMYNFDHDSPDSPVQTARSGSKPNKKKGGKWHHRQARRSPTPPEFFRSPGRESLSYADSQRLVEISLEGRLHRIDIYEPLEIISQDEIDNQDNTEKEEKAEKSPQKSTRGAENGKANGKANGKVRKENIATTNQPIKLPEAQVKVLDDYIKPNGIPPRPSSYYRYIEKSLDELDEEVEYDMDEEDHAWLEIVNDKRCTEGVTSISQEVFETLMDRFEKEAFFQSQTSGKDQGPSIDEDAVCSICMDGECQNSNVILFCDMCNLAVHQECYGVPYIPEGQWLCRRCLQSPSRAVDCCLCPNKGGAFKQTDDGRWSHVVCALWVPEVGFANTVFLEPIDSLERIPPARKKLTCYICKQRGSGACIQCHKTNCYTAFHVTCAQQAGLFMKIEAIKEPGPSGVAAGVRKTAFCDVHTPANSDWTPMLADDDSPTNSISAKEAKAKSRIKMRKARKILAEKRNAVPVVSIPIIPQQRLTKIAAMVSIPKRDQFLKRLLSYWTLKRQSRFGVPLLRRLQSNHMTRNRDHMKNDKQSNALREQLKYWQRLRQDLEKARLLVELIRKREKLKREQLRLHQMALELQLQPFTLLLRQTLDQLQEKDTESIFAEPVSLEEVPDYLDYIKTPMDFSSMRAKVDGHEYRSLDDFHDDFELIVNNCITYNSKDTMFYKAALKLKEQGGTIIRAAKKLAERVGFDMETGLHLPHPPQKDEAENLEDFASFMHDVRQSLPLEEQLQTLLDKMEMANTQLTGGQRAKFAKNIRKQIMQVRRKLSMQKRKMEAADSKSPDAASTGTDSEGQDESPQSETNHVSTEASATTSKEKMPSPLMKTPVRAGGRGVGRGRGRGRMASRSESESEPPKVIAHERGISADTTKLGAAGQPEEVKNAGVSHTPSPAGVNRRTAVLLNSKKAARSAPASSSLSTAHAEAPSSPQPTPRKPGRPPKNKGQHSQHPHVEIVEPRSPESIQSSGPASPLGPFLSGRKRSASLGHSSETETRPSPPKRALSLNDSALGAIGDGPDGPDLANRDSFKTYRIRNIRSSSESDSTSELSSGDESESSTGSSSNQSPSARQRRSPSVDYDDLITLEPLDLVWAKCRGYPWYPALIINPKMPKTGYFHNGVPIPVPPDHVLELQRKYDETVYLVLFFDTKRTWQWLPRQKLEPLGVNSDLDKSKLMENKKPNVRKAVQKAYEKAIIHRCKVNGEPNPLSGDSSSEG